MNGLTTGLIEDSSEPWSLVLSSAHVLDTFGLSGVNPVLSRSSRASLRSVHQHHLPMHDLFQQSTVVDPQDMSKPSQSSYLDNKITVSAELSSP